MEPSKYLSGPVRRLGSSLLSLGRIRLELLALEVQEEKDRIVMMLFWALLSAFLAGFGLMLLALFVTVALWDTHRLAALGGATVVLVGVALFGALRAKRLAAGESTLFQSSIAELRKDSAALNPGPPP